MQDELWMISVDDRVVEPPDVWETRVPARFKDEAPRVRGNAERIFNFVPAPPPDASGPPADEEAVSMAGGA